MKYRLWGPLLGDSDSVDPGEAQRDGFFNRTHVGLMSMLPKALLKMWV